MDILGIGPTELVFIVLIALILLGPKEMQKAGRTVGRWLRDFVASDSWRAFRDTSREIRNLPNRLMREANLEDMQDVSKDIQDSSREMQDLSKDLRDASREISDSINPRKERFGTWGSPKGTDPKPAQSKPAHAEPPQEKIAPPTTAASEEEESSSDA
jgi:sec-independent protein translocase protein TatB